MILSLFFTHKLSAQILFDDNLTSVNRVELGSFDADEDNRPNKLILIYDSTSLTFEFTESGELALISTCTTLHSNAVGNPNVSTSSSGIILTEKYIQSIMKEAVDEAVDEEEDLEINDWMIHPEKWQVN